MVADGGAVMGSACASGFRRRWSILLTFKKINEFGVADQIRTYYPPGGFFFWTSSETISL
jgi:hypothetical protein